ncbi:MAG TPA: fibrillarin-like rRNA/tRNA 2'-O-methyltransferase [Candidatus Nanoarchaeia archaeon]|nr:fibrillarin-like rRNA/tRNA 2'-O-methyltransferase [Candidatus Nanoarchaeia archaeon]
MEFEKTKYNGVYISWKDKRKLYFTKGKDSLFGERLIEGYREVNITRSKIFAAIAKGISKTFLKEGDKVLYLGASYGYTPSFISDIVGDTGFVFCIDFAPRVVIDLVNICEKRKNMTAILGNASKPEEYQDRIVDVDVIYQDVAQKNQVDILFKNLKFLKKNGYILFAIKARSINVIKNPKVIFKEIEEQLKKQVKILDFMVLDPYEKDHCFYICQKK